ncbi:MAG: hypothetical protein KJ550_12890 [Proteobacteria bacterium]|nr:hypothetical protein [Pseudomonadota bacterium]MBU4067829.1 hypothetical protein [Pseudomonadota bacterium]MBU4126818.1 hypothetical protein [Pseudomonadota bacterium]
MIDILNHYTLGFDQDRHIEGFSPEITCCASLAPYKLTCPQCFATRGGRGGYACPPSLSLRRGGRGAVAEARVNIFCFLKKLSDTCLPEKAHRN